MQEPPGVLTTRLGVFERKRALVRHPSGQPGLETPAQVRVDRRVDACVSKTSIVRYDAYEGAGGHQYASLAFLNSARSGVVVSAIQGRDYARIYVKELDRGKAPIALSPEELEAVERAMAS